MVVNSVWRSGLFSSVGRSVFSSQARSCAEGSRGTDGAAAALIVEVVPFALSLMFGRSQLAFVWTENPKERGIPCYAKAESGARGRSGNSGNVSKGVKRTGRSGPEPLCPVF